MTVVITGGAGHIGCHVALELIAAGHAPVLFDNFSNSSPTVLSALARLAGRPVPCVEGDIRERGDLDRVLGDGAVSAVLHLAAYTGVQFDGGALRRGGWAAFGRRAHCPIKPVRADEARDRADAAGAERRRSALEGSILRYFNVAGTRPSGLLLESPVGPPQNLPPRVADVAAAETGEIPVFGDDYATPDGTCVRDYVHVLDVAHGHVRALA